MNLGAKHPSVNATVYKMGRKQGDATVSTSCTTTVECINCDARAADLRVVNPLHPGPPPPPPSPAQPDDVIAPPMGIRSSPALGGVSA